MRLHVAAAALLFSGVAAAAPLGLAGSYNSFIFGDFHGSSDTEGRLAVGGDAYLEHYSVGDKLPANSGAVLVVGGDLTITGGRVYHGDAWVGGSAHLPGYPVVDGELHVGAGVPIDFAAEASYLTQLSTSLSAISANGNVVSRWGGLELYGDGSSALQVFNVDGAQLAGIHTLSIAALAADATVLINVSGSSSALSSMGMWSFESIRERVLFNFFEADLLNFGSVAINGSVLAPKATINNSWGVIWGTTVANHWYGPMQQNHVPFEGELPQTNITVPEPQTLFLAAFLCLLLLSRRRFS